MTRKGRQFFQEKIGVTLSVAAPGDTNPSGASGLLPRLLTISDYEPVGTSAEWRTLCCQRDRALWDWDWRRTGRSSSSGPWGSGTDRAPWSSAPLPSRRSPWTPDNATTVPKYQHDHLLWTFLWRSISQACVCVSYHNCGFLPRVTDVHRHTTWWRTSRIKISRGVRCGAGTNFHLRRKHA